MRKAVLIISFSWLTLLSFPQGKSFNSFLSDSAMTYSSVSFCVADAENGEVMMEYNSGKSLAPASIMKLITTAAALELLGPEYTFKTKLGYTGSLNKNSGKLTGNIVITGGGDPSLGSPYFSDHYKDFPDKWIMEIKKLGIKKIDGRVITDDSYYDYLPVPSKWLWEDAGNYYGAGVYGLSAFDNTYEIHINTLADSTRPVITKSVPCECKNEFSNWLVASGTKDEGYVFAAPYSTTGWLTGTIPSKMEDFVLKASIPDPPLLMARMVTERLEAAGISVSEDPTTVRIEHKSISDEIVPVSETISPPLAGIIKVLNNESVNLYAEHLIKELGRNFKNNSSTASGVDVVKEFLNNCGINTDGMFISDGSGLSPGNAINTRELVRLLVYMKNNGKYFQDYYASLPAAGKEGTLRYYFKDPAFKSRLKAKSGSMTRVRSYSGYFTTISGKNLAFSIIINNYSGPSKNIISGIEEILKEIILTK